MKWRGYRDDHALLHDINALILDCVPESRCHELVTELKHLRQKLCIYHVSQFCTMMRVASSIAESTHSAIKGGGEFKKMLRASNFYETMLHILQLMKICIDDTVADLKRFKDKGWHYSPYARSFIDKAWASMAQCTRLTQETDNCWHVVQNVPEFKGGSKRRRHSILFLLMFNYISSRFRKVGQMLHAHALSILKVCGCVQLFVPFLCDWDAVKSTRTYLSCMKFGICATILSGVYSTSILLHDAVNAYMLTGAAREAIVNSTQSCSALGDTSSSISGSCSPKSEIPSL